LECRTFMLVWNDFSPRCLQDLSENAVAGSARLDILTYAGHDQCVSQNGPSCVSKWQHYDSLRRMVRVPWYASGDLSSVIQHLPDGNILITRAFALGAVTALPDRDRQFLPPESWFRRN
jgi:hypothetical protein